MKRAFCPTCRTMREVMDEYETDIHERPVYVARPLECGHNADDGGGLPYKPRLASRAAIERKVVEVVELQEGSGL